MQFDINGLRNNVDMKYLLDSLGIRYRQSGANYFLLCPNPSHEDSRPTNCFFKDGDFKVYCTVCSQSFDAIDIIQWTLGMSFRDAVEHLWKLEGEPEWAVISKGKKKEGFYITPKECRLIGIDHPYGSISIPIRYSPAKEKIDHKSEYYDPKEIDGYLLYKKKRISYRDVFTETGWQCLVLNKAKEAMSYYGKDPETGVTVDFRKWKAARSIYYRAYKALQQKKKRGVV